MPIDGLDCYTSPPSAAHPGSTPPHTTQSPLPPPPYTPLQKSVASQVAGYLPRQLRWVVGRLAHVQGLAAAEVQLAHEPLFCVELGEIASSTFTLENCDDCIRGQQRCIPSAAPT